MWAWVFEIRNVVCAMADTLVRLWAPNELNSIYSHTSTASSQARQVNNSSLRAHFVSPPTPPPSGSRNYTVHQ
jgi:hypothetical protein